MSRFLNELEASRLLSSYGIPMVESFLCKTAAEVAKFAGRLTFPVVMKVLSTDIQHKTDAGCVFIGLESKSGLQEAYEKIIKNASRYNPNAKIDGVLVQEMAEKGLEIIVGMKRDPQFGPVLMVGTGGIYVEVFHDVALRLVPLRREDTESMVAETMLSKIIDGTRGMVYDKKVLTDVLLKVSSLVEAHPEIEELDINPLFLYEQGKGAKGIDALIKLI